MVPRELLKKKSRVDKDGQTFDWWELQYKLLVSIESGPMLFSLVCGGKEYEKAEAEY